MKEPSSQAKQLLALEFAERKRRNPLYSLRAYARDLGVSLGLISEILAGKRPITAHTGQRIVPHLQFSHYEKRIFLNCLLVDSGAAPSGPDLTNVEQLCDDQFRLIADWYHFAILSLAKTSDCKPTPSFIARRLGISLAEAELALSRLKRLRLIRKEGRRLVRTTSIIETTIDIPSHAIKTSHRQTLEQTIAALYQVPVDRREILSTTVATTPEKMSQAKAMMREFAASMREFLESGPKTEVYNLNLQFVPVTIAAQTNTNTPH